MTTIEIRNGHVAQMQPEAAQQPVVRDLTFIHDAPVAIGRANALGSYLITGEMQKSEEDTLLGDLGYTAENLYLNNATVIECRQGALSSESVEKAFRLAEDGYNGSLDTDNLLIVKNLDALIGTGGEEPTTAQKLAINALMKWTTNDEASSRYASLSYPQKERKICALMNQPELETHRLRLALIGSFASSDAFIGIDQVEELPDECARELVAA